MTRLKELLPILAWAFVYTVMGLATLVSLVAVCGALAWFFIEHFLTVVGILLMTLILYWSFLVGREIAKILRG